VIKKDGKGQYMPQKSPKQIMKTNQAIENSSRRNLLTRLWYVLGGLALIEVIWVAISFLKGQKRPGHAADRKKIIDAGPVQRFEANSVTAFPQGRFYLACLEDGGFLALSRKCTHLGCTVPWDAEKRQFVCPCHASVFNIRGEVIHAPAPRPLDRFAIVIENNRIMVEVEKTIRRRGFSTKEVVYKNRVQGGQDSKGQG
jgi:cytochrome b6-f complex iron-sulfur subunit